MMMMTMNVSDAHMPFSMPIFPGSETYEALTPNDEQIKGSTRKREEEEKRGTDGRTDLDVIRAGGNFRGKLRSGFPRKKGLKSF